MSHHDDKLLGTERGYGQARRPEDYLQEFSDFIRTSGNAIPALVTVLTRPRELTRKQLRELALELDKAGFSEASLATAWREMTNQDIAARIVGYIRQAAIGDPLVPYDQRVDSALQKLLASRPGAHHSASGSRRSRRRPRLTCSSIARPWTTPTSSSDARVAASPDSTVFSVANSSRCWTPSTNRSGLRRRWLVRTPLCTLHKH